MSLIDALVDAQAKEAGWPVPEREYRYVPSRKFRADYAFPAQRVLLEIQGGVFTHQAHGSISGLLRDIERGNFAAAYGWRLIRLTPSQIKEGSLTAWLQMLGLNQQSEAA